PTHPPASAALDAFFDHYYAADPVQATFTGVHDHDGRLPDWSPDGLEAAAAAAHGLRRLLDAAGRVEDEAVRDYPGAVDLALADGWLEIQLAEEASGHFVRRNPALWTGEAIFGAIALVTRPFAEAAVRVESLVARLAAIPAFLADARRVCRDMPAPWRERALRECEAAVPLLRDRLPAWWRQQHVAANAVTAADSASRGACAAFEDFAAWLRRSPAGREAVAAGGELMTLLLRRGHWCATPPRPLLAEAREALDAEAAALDELARELSPDGWAAVREAIAARHPAAA